MEFEIEILKPGIFNGVTVTDKVIDEVIASYNPTLVKAPLILGHDDTDTAPAHGWIASLFKLGQSAWARVENVTEEMQCWIREGKYGPRSVWIDTKYPTPGVWYLRHLGMLGAANPAVTGMAPLKFGASDTGFKIEITPEPMSFRLSADEFKSLSTREGSNKSASTIDARGAVMNLEELKAANETMAAEKKELETKLQTALDKQKELEAKLKAPDPAKDSDLKAKLDDTNEKLATAQASLAKLQRERDLAVINARLDKLGNPKHKELKLAETLADLPEDKRESMLKALEAESHPVPTGEFAGGNIPKEADDFTRRLAQGSTNIDLSSVERRSRAREAMAKNPKMTYEDALIAVSQEGSNG